MLVDFGRENGCKLAPKWGPNSVKPVQYHTLGRLGASWGQPGVNLGPTWGPNWASWGVLGPTWGQPGANLGPTWSQPGANLGPNLGFRLRRDPLLGAKWASKIQAKWIKIRCQNRCKKQRFPISENVANMAPTWVPRWNQN